MSTNDAVIHRALYLREILIIECSCWTGSLADKLSRAREPKQAWLFGDVQNFEQLRRSGAPISFVRVPGAVRFQPITVRRYWTMEFDQRGGGFDLNCGVLTCQTGKESDVFGLPSFDVAPIIAGVFFDGLEDLFVELRNLRKLTVVQSQQTCLAKVKRCIAIAFANQQLVNPGFDSRR